MVGERLGRRRFAAAGEIIGAGADHPADVTDLPRDQIAVGQPADPHRDIDMRLDQIDHLVGQHQPDRHIGIGGEEGVDDRRDVELAEHDRRGDQQFAARGAILAARGALGIPEIVEQPPGDRDERLAGLGQDQLAAGAHEQLRAEMRLQVRHAPADRGQRRVQRA